MDGSIVHGIPYVRVASTHHMHARAHAVVNFACTRSFSFTTGVLLIEWSVHDGVSTLHVHGVRVRANHTRTQHVLAVPYIHLSILS